MRSLVLLPLAVAAAAPRDWSSFSFEDYKRAFGRTYKDAASEAVAAHSFAKQLADVLGHHDVVAHSPVHPSTHANAKQAKRTQQRWKT